MGVRADITAYSEAEGHARAAAKAAFDEMSRVESVLTDYRADSEAMRLCDAPAGTPVPVSPILAEALTRSAEFSRATDGAFDITVGPLVRLWRAARRDGVVPTESEWSAGAALVGWKRITLTRGSSGTTATLGTPGVRLDFGGIGKGFAADRAGAVLRVHGIERYLVALAGDMAIGGPPPGAEGWEIALATKSGVAPTARLTLARSGVSTSGDSEQSIVIGGRRYSHIVDPRRGRPLASHRTVTVIAPDATTSDALGTAFCMLAPNEADRVAAAFGARVFEQFAPTPADSSENP